MIRIEVAGGNFWRWFLLVRLCPLSSWHKRASPKTPLSCLQVRNPDMLLIVNRRLHQLPLTGQAGI